MSRNKNPSYVGGHTVWTTKDFLTEKDRRKATKAAREARQRSAERANDRLADAAARALIEAEAAKPAGPSLELRRITGPDGRKVTVRVWH
jgi:hypothetical protein